MASMKYMKGSCYKLNDVAKLIRGLGVMDADLQHPFCEKRVAVLVKKLLKSAVANAENNFKINKERLQVSRVEVGKSFVLKRSMPRGRGRMTRIEKRYSNLKIFLSEKKIVENKSKKVVNK